MYLARQNGSNFGASRCPCCDRLWQTALILRVIMAFEVFAVVAALGGTLFPVLMGGNLCLSVRLVEQWAQRLPWPW